MQIELQGTRKLRSTTWSGSWSNGVPDSYTNVELSSAYDTGINGSFTCNNLTISANLIIAANTWVKVLGPLVTQTSSVTFNVANNGELVLLHPLVDVSTVKLTANFTPQVSLQRLDYWTLSSPLTDIPVLNISPTTTTTRFYEYGYGQNSTGAYSEAFSSFDPNLKVLEGKGYLIRTPGSFPSTATNWNISINNLSGGRLNKGVIFHTPSFYNSITVGGNGYCMIGNPYLASLDLRKFLQYNSNKLKDLIHIWYKTNNSERESYVQLNSVESRSSVFSTKIRPFQGFIVQYINPADTGTELIFTPDMQIVEKNFDHNYFTLDYKQSSVNIPVGSCTYNADIFEQNFNEYLSAGLLSFIKDDINKAIYHDITPYDGQVIDMYYKAVATENFTISLMGFGGSFNGFKILLMDNLLNTSTNLKETAYTFAGVSGESSSDRFKIKITNL